MGTWENRTHRICTNLNIKVFKVSTDYLLELEDEFGNKI